MRTTIGERVRTYRLKRGLTQARLAHLIGRSERWLIDVERGGVDPRLSDALALARELCVAVDDLAGRAAPVEERAGRPPPRPPVHKYHVTTRRRRWLWSAGWTWFGLGGGMRGHRGRRWRVGCDRALAAVTHLRGRYTPRVYSSFLTSSIENGRR
jgi:transcriptional regulator with XRE-family HTH domain